MIANTTEFNKIGKKVFTSTGNFLGQVKSESPSAVVVDKPILPILPFGYRRKIPKARIAVEDDSTLHLEVTQNEYWQIPYLEEQDLAIAFLADTNKLPSFRLSMSHQPE